MVHLICGVLAWNPDYQQEPILHAMIGSLACFGEAKTSVRTSGQCSLAKVSVGSSARNSCNLAEADDHTLTGDFDVSFWCVSRIDDVGLRQEDVLRSWTDDPEKVLSRIDGEFAFCVWDHKAEKLHLVRDHLGTRPLFYAYDPGKFFAFSSLPSAFIDAGLISGAVDFEQMAKFTVRNFDSSERTLLKGSLRVQQGETISVSRSGICRKRYWVPRSTPDYKSPISYCEAIKGLRDRLERSVRRRLPKSGTAFSHLSGGLDSTGVAAIGAKILSETDRRLTAYSFVPADDNANNATIDERPEVYATADWQKNIDLVEFPSLTFEKIGDAKIYRDFILFDDDEFEYSRLIDHASSNDADRVLSGFGGDQAASYKGRGAHLELFLSGRWDALARLLRHRIDGVSGWQILFKEIGAYVVPRQLYPMMRLIRGKPLRPGYDPKMFLLPAFREVADHNEHPAPHQSTMFRHWSLFNGHISMVMEDLFFCASQRGLKYCHPLLDRELIEYTLSLPPEFFLADGQRRRIYRDAIAGYVPDSVRLRDAKLLPDPAGVLALIRDKEKMLSRVEMMRDGGAAELFNLDGLAAEISALPDRATVEQEMAVLAKVGKQYNPAAKAGFAQALLNCIFVHGAGRQRRDQTTDQNPE